jgi:pantetheine-phosphate adenylyltransferase
MIAVYPGSFDPITSGHFDIIERAAARFDKVVVVVAVNSNKTCTFTAELRSEMIHSAVSSKGLKNVEVDIFSDGLLVDYVESVGAHVIIKGLRAVSDFEYEFQMALINRHVRPDIETLFMMTRAEFSFLSSSIVREMVRLGGDISGLVPESVVESIHSALGKTIKSDK